MTELIPGNIVMLPKHFSFWVSDDPVDMRYQLVKFAASPGIGLVIAISNRRIMLLVPSLGLGWVASKCLERINAENWE